MFKTGDRVIPVDRQRAGAAQKPDAWAPGCPLSPSKHSPTSWPSSQIGCLFGYPEKPRGVPRSRPVPFLNKLSLCRPVFVANAQQRKPSRV
ncbi:uncharacterized [Tachysurus ichikawai]